MKSLRAVLIVLVVIIAAAAGGYAYWQAQQSDLPDYIASGNGRIEAEEVRVATK
ncbi:MAG TPA: efflux transporter periplasmic adaptor subunit, partial [Thalassospira sp.]|nr:efflux transporter periplasmic adaptor subunit [Thalassospira sp.]